MESLIGVTRVARVTGLDRSGIEVACAVRPGGHVLQVANGKGESWEEARASALSEAAEMWAAERPAELEFGAAEDFAEAWPPGEVLAPALWSQTTRIAWRRARELFSGRPLHVPAQAIHCPPRGGVPLGPAIARWTTNGMGAHPQRRAALQHALLETLERDQLARALPEGWTPRAIRQRKLDASALPLWQKLRRARLEAHLFDLSGELPVAAALLVDLDEGPVPLTAGYACALTPERAARGALLEAAQSRLTDVHGAREDVAAADRLAAAALRQACEGARPLRRLQDLPSARSVRQAFRGRRVAVIELADQPLHVIKIFTPQMRLSELL